MNCNLLAKLVLWPTVDVAEDGDNNVSEGDGDNDDAFTDADGDGDADGDDDKRAFLDDCEHRLRSIFPLAVGFLSIFPSRRWKDDIVLTAEQDLGSC